MYFFRCGGIPLAGVGGGGDGWLLLARFYGLAVEFEARGDVHAWIIWSEVAHVSLRVHLVASGAYQGLFAGRSWPGASGSDGTQFGIKV